MRAGRLVTLLLLLERRGRLTAGELAAELEVSERTVLRDVDELSGAGVPVFAVRGPGGGYELLEGTGTALADPGTWQPMDRRAGRVRRAAVRVTPDGRRLAAVLGRLQPLRVRRSAAPDAAGRLEATFRIGAFEGAVLDLCSLSREIEVLAPEDLRAAVATRLRAAASQYAAPDARRGARPPLDGDAGTTAQREGERTSETPVRLDDGVITLRAWELTDAEAVFAACQDPVIARFLPIPLPYTEEVAREFVAIRRADWDGDDERSFAITDAATGEVLGSIARHQRAEHRAEFGYWLAPQARGRGIATRALCLIADWSLAQGFLRLELFTHPDNAASGAVAQRAGFDFEGVRRAWDTDRDGNPEDGVFYVRIASGPS